MPPTLLVFALRMFTLRPVFSTRFAMKGSLECVPSKTIRTILPEGSEGSKGLLGKTSFFAALDLGLEKTSLTSPTSARLPSSMIATRSQIFSTTDISCVMMTIVSFLSRLIFLRRSNISPVIFGSNALVASSHKRTLGSAASALAIATLCFWPPERRAGNTSCLSRSPTISSIWRAFSLRSLRGTPAIFRGCSTLDRTVLWLTRLNP